MSGVLHPKCGKRFPAGNRAGHCASCCGTFIGLQSFEAHRVGEHGEDRHCEILPYRIVKDGKTRYGHWLDERGYWHYGERLTDEQKEQMWGATP